ncbi:polysaccharide deacetylase family protein [Flavobacterium sp. J372]|uniref:polysaccharide deacetylase family protein n=1 Tax=Flavobacterium sp. J372 TaxID=2898436 RepID=UPI0021512079|nr:polysaccharide deacetylase family protein [Flavobacterium sp. J372]MCR5861378.1 polysaccharide deacetylase family protein [Flavobacterium sp. J372]
MITHKANIIANIAAAILIGAAAFFYGISWWYLLFPFGIWLITAVIGSGLVQTGYHVRTFCSNKDVTEKLIAITFDDGPTPETPKVLELLKKYDVKATFFCIGRQIEKYPDILQQVIDEGHTVGNHTYSHSPKMSLWNTEAVSKELTKTDEIIYNIVGVRTKLYRPPYGVTFPQLARSIKVTKHKVIGWNIRSLDAVIDDEQHILKRITSRLKPGSIILLHDTSQKSVNVLEQLLVILQRENYKPVTVDKLLNIKAYED